MANFFTGSPASSQQFSTITPQQQGVKSAVNRQALQLLQNAGSTNLDFAPIAQQARAQFQTNTIPTLAERFTSLGSGAQRSSAFQGQLGQASSNLEQGLASLQSNYGLQRQGLQNNLLKSLLAFGLSPEVETALNPEDPGFLKTLLANYGPQALSLLATSIGGLFGGPLGAAAGGAVGSGLGSLISQSPSTPSIPTTQSPISAFPNYAALIQNVLKGQL